MAIKKSHPMRFSPAGLADAFDSTATFPGACVKLSNFVFDQSNPEYVVPRPGVISLASLAGLGFSSPAFISVQVFIGTRIYGLVATSRFPGHDEPFCIDSAGFANVPVTGVTSGNTPLSPSTSGEWTPPTVANIGSFLIFTHPGFDGATHFFGALNIVTMAWTSGNLATNPLTALPVAVANFNNRAYFAVGNQLPYSDVLAPLTRTNASQQLAVGDNGAINALAGLPLQTTSSGVLGALTVFKQSQIWQVTGDTTTGDLSLNYLSLSIGTTMPRSIAQSPQGLYFGSNGGPYFVDPLGTVRQLTRSIQESNPDINAPFQNATTPTRWAGAYAAGIYRVCGPTVAAGAAITNDYWFDERRRRWNGPHTFAYDCASAMGSNFILTSANNPGIVAQSPALPSNSSAVNDLSTFYNCTLQSAAFPKAGDMEMKQVAESEIELGDGTRYSVLALDETGNQLGGASILSQGSTAPTWGGGGTWGGGLLWTASGSGPARTYAVPWTAPLVFEKMALYVTCAASQSAKVGTFQARYQQTGYMTVQRGA